MAFSIYEGPVKRTIKTEEISPRQRLVEVSTFYDQPPGTVTTSSSEGYLPASTRFYDSTAVKNWRALMEEGWIINNPFTTLRTVWSATPCSLQDEFWNESSWWKHWSNTHSNVVSSINIAESFPEIPSDNYGWESARDEAVTRVFAKANAGNADLLVDLFQIRETVQMFVNALRTCLALVQSKGAFAQILEAILSHSNRRVRVPLEGRDVLLRTLSGLWCELRFGWRPLLGTLDGIVEAIQSMNGDTKRVTYRASEEYTFRKENVLETTSTQNGFSLPVIKKVRVDFRSTFRAGILLEETPALAHALGLELAQVPYALWDCVPWSFIWDRFVNIGNFIRSLRPIPTSRFCGAWVVERFERNILRQCEYVAGDQSSGSGSSYKRWARSGGTSTVLEQTIGYQRIPVLRPPTLPVLRHDWSEFQNLYNLIDVLMLAIQRVIKVR